MREFVVAALWIGPLSVLLYLSDVDVRHVVSEIPDLLRSLVAMFFS
ncbi:hypothetical protein [Burkholderia stagnalis]|nr:hypothetical protein [Burkholderia stagnalis]MDY7800912.1 hypothetical protein [Burkholderia stagnalis]VWB33811.1 hypothetical protein BST28156_01499 [Burkholderia stagnalis]